MIEHLFCHDLCATISGNKAFVADGTSAVGVMLNKNAATA